MNLVYLPVSSLPQGLSTSAALWNLVRPNPAAGEITQYLYPVITDINGKCWANVDLDFLITVPIGSTGGKFITAISAAIAAGILEPLDLSVIETAIITAQGLTVAVSTLLPPDLLAEGLTYSQMVANGNLAATPGALPT